jgi:hypothetical protein
MYNNQVKVAVMQKMYVVCAGLVVFLGVVAGVLWGQLRTERQLVSELREQMAQMQAQLSEARQTPQQGPQVMVASAPPVAATKVPEPTSKSTLIPVPMPPVAVPVQVAPPAREVAAPPVTAEERRALAIREADEAATGRARIWSDAMSQAGLPLSTEQFQALTAASISEHRRDAEDSIAQQRNTTPRDAEDAFRIREENLIRMNETNLRILQAARPQLTEAQASALRAQFDKGHSSRMASLRTERERAQQAGQPAR